MTGQFCTLQIPLWKCGLNLKEHSAPIFKSLIFFEPLLSIYITSGFECLWLTKESGKVMGIQRPPPVRRVLKFYSVLRLDWSYPWAVIGWLEQPDTLWPWLVLQLHLSQGAPVCNSSQGLPLVQWHKRCVCYVQIFWGRTF